jgi:hypothetical protein
VADVKRAEQQLSYEEEMTDDDVVWKTAGIEQHEEVVSLLQPA